MAFVKFDDKDARECLDYTIDFSDLLPAGSQLASATAVIESVKSGPGSPTPSPDPVLTFRGSPHASVVSSGATSPAINDQVLIWLESGHTGATYTIRVDALDSESAPGPRCYTRRATIKIKDK